MENKNFKLNIQTDPGFKVAKIMNKAKKEDQLNAFIRNSNEMRSGQLDRGDHRNPHVKIETRKLLSNQNKIPNEKKTITKPTTPCKDLILPAKAIQTPRQDAKSNVVKSVLSKYEQVPKCGIEKNQTDKIEHCTLILDAAIQKIMKEDASKSTSSRSFVDYTSKSGAYNHAGTRHMGRDSNIIDYTGKGGVNNHADNRNMRRDSNLVDYIRKGADNNHVGYKNMDKDKNVDCTRKGADNHTAYRNMGINGILVDYTSQDADNNHTGNRKENRNLVNYASKGGANNAGNRNMDRVGNRNLVDYTKKGADSKTNYISKGGGSKEKKTMMSDRNNLKEKPIRNCNKEKRDHEKIENDKIVPCQSKRQSIKQTEITEKKEMFQETATNLAVSAQVCTNNREDTYIRKSTTKTIKTKERKPGIKTITSENNINTENQNEPSQVQIKDRFGKLKTLKSQSPKLDSVDENFRTIMQILANSDATSQPKLKSKTKLKGKIPIKEKGLYQKRKKSEESPERPIFLTDSSPMTEVAKWAPSCIDHHTKPYYEAWVDTTLTSRSRSKDRQNIEKELIRSLKKYLGARPQTPELVHADMNDERYTGRIRIRHKHM